MVDARSIFKIFPSGCAKFALLNIHLKVGHWHVTLATAYSPGIGRNIKYGLFAVPCYLNMMICRELAGGWKLVVMEYLSKHDGWDSVFESRNDPQLKEAVEDCVDMTRQLPRVYVHGDLRPLNILVRQ